MVTFLLILQAITFLIGVSCIPIFAMLARGAIPGFLSEALGGTLLLAVLAPSPDAVTIHQDPNQYRYRFISEKEKLQPQRYRSKFYGADFALTYTNTEDTWGDDAVEIHPEHLEDDLKPDHSRYTDINRNDFPSFIETTADHADNVFVKIGQTISRWRNAANLQMIHRAHRNATEQHGGDTGSTGIKWTFFATITFTVIGLVMGWIVFF